LPRGGIVEKTLVGTWNARLFKKELSPVPRMIKQKNLKSSVPCPKYVLFNHSIYAKSIQMRGPVIASNWNSSI
jgi:hypothetical protein